MPFFMPLFEERAHIDFFGPCLGGLNIEQVVTPVMSPPYFPVDIRKLPSHRTFHTISDEEQIIWHNVMRDRQSSGRRRKRRAKRRCVSPQGLRTVIRWMG